MRISRDHGEARSPVQAAAWLDLKKRYMELRPNPRRRAASIETVRGLGYRFGAPG